MIVKWRFTVEGFYDKKRSANLNSLRGAITPGADLAFVRLENAICAFLYFRFRFTSLSRSFSLRRGRAVNKMCRLYLAEVL